MNPDSFPEATVELTAPPFTSINSVLAARDASIVGTAIEAVMKFKTSDGTSFDTLAEARHHHARAMFIDDCIADDINSLSAEDFLVPAEDVADWISDNRGIVRDFLMRLDAIEANKADPC
jgi:hypothetical protein